MKTTRLLFILFLLLMAACSSPEEEISVATAPPSPPTSTAVPDTPTPSPTDTPFPEPTSMATTAPTETPLPADTMTPTAEPTDAPVFTIPRFAVEDRFTIYGDEPAVPRGDHQFTDPGAVLFHDGQFHMLHNVFTGWPAPVDIVYSRSEDGINWERVQEEAVLDGTTVPFAGVTALASSALVLEDGTWVLYFYTWDDSTWPRSAGTIGLATAPGPVGPWSVHDTPILLPGDDSDWDSMAVRTPSVVQTEDGFVMYYAGVDNGGGAIGMATSTDGINWEKYDDPATVEAPYTNSDPIFTGSGEEIWDKTNAVQPHVQLTPDGWVMLYVSAPFVTRTPVNNRHGMAVSVDGIEWVRSETALFAPRDVQSGAGNIWFANFLYANDTYYVYIELGRGGNTEIYVATLDEPLLP